MSRRPLTTNERYEMELIAFSKVPLMADSEEERERILLARDRLDFDNMLRQNQRMFEKQSPAPVAPITPVYEPTDEMDTESRADPEYVPEKETPEEEGGEEEEEEEDVNSNVEVPPPEPVQLPKTPSQPKPRNRKQHQ